MAVRVRISVLFAAVCECFARNFVSVVFITNVVRCVLVLNTGVITSLARTDEIWEIVIRPKVESFHAGTKPFDYVFFFL